MSDLIDRVKKQLRVDAERVRHAQWIDAFIDMPVHVCSLCNASFPLVYTGGGDHYCPNCGAKMDEEVEE